MDISIPLLLLSERIALHMYCIEVEPPSYPSPCLIMFSSFRRLPAQTSVTGMVISWKVALMYSKVISSGLSTAPPTRTFPPAPASVTIRVRCITDSQNKPGIQPVGFLPLCAKTLETSLLTAVLPYHHFENGYWYAYIALLRMHENSRKKKKRKQEKFHQIIRTDKRTCSQMMPPLVGVDE